MSTTIATRLPRALLLVGVLLPTLGTGCVINDGGNDDGSGDDAADDGGSAGDDGAPADDGSGDGAPADDGAEGDDGAADSTDGGGDGGGDGGAADGPSPGSWLYEETGGTTNDCTFLDDPSNGFGTYLVASDGPGTFTITPGDGTDPFSCTHDGASFECAERLQDEIAMGGTSLQVLVALDGDLLSSTEMEGTQDGRIECTGDCATAEAALGTTFPCEFSIPWQGTKQ